ncbi:hypothetical protein HYO62_09930 [Aerococcaceae bacterium DSM 111022]|nr:hypothetical protein [Aerococcaceae bacterium DSM 111022]
MESVHEKLSDAVKYLDNESAELVLRSVNKLTETVEPEEWEIESILEWESMSQEERQQDSISHENLKKEWGLK